MVVRHVTLSEAQAQCRANGVDLRVSGRGATACMDLLAPFCPDGVLADVSEELPRCAGPGPSARKAAILNAEANARAAAAASQRRLLIGGGVLAAGLVLWLVLKG